MSLWVSYKKNMKRNKINNFASLKPLKKVVGSRVGSGSIIQRYASVEPDPHQNITDPQQCKKHTVP
jgi:hypothetical protein